ncbi:AAA family ATPase [Candidatus Albibeggiatoa sp. nov. NOAA]|uniref:AAA family ATPase n=1 Tax=Candidatus Albibeggiatoa sp. nov. NOAA TaxID=3162724 RepID=UPI0032F87060|nr:AAA family ATPase [Thiotrichaceae bacterium]
MQTTLFNLPDYKVHNQIDESASSLIYRGERISNSVPIIIKIQKHNFPTPDELVCYQQEFNITNKIVSDGVIQAYELKKYNNKLYIVLEDIDGCSLKQILQQRYTFSIPTFLHIAIDLAQALSDIHASNVIHKDINPANIVWNPTTQQLKVIDFSISSILPREITHLKNPNQLEGTLSYISPEQTGRMNCNLDYRTDLYSLGITFYELLTQQLPYDSLDPLELVHCHIAKPIVPPHHINQAIPLILSNIVMQLIAKNVEQRYQSALGLKHDLEVCLESLDHVHNLDFPLAQQDYSGQFHIPQKLYGREHEIAQLLDSFERVTQGHTEMILVAGYSGVGKSALVNAVHLPMAEKQGYFAAGKFDQYQRNTPYSAISQAFEDFCHYLLTETKQQLEIWKHNILSAIGQNGQVLIDVIPALEYIIGKQPAVTTLNSQAAQNRFNLVFQRFLQVLCQAGHPVTLFIDDWQWADSASLNLLQLLLNDSELGYLLIIGAYRSNEVDETHPFHITITALKKHTHIQEIQLSNLTQQDVAALIADTLHQPTDSIEQLTQLVYEKTLGNAFFATTLLKTLYEEGLLYFDLVCHCWLWNAQKIQHKALADNVVDLMSGKIRKQMLQTQRVLQLAASVGNQFNLQTLSIIYNQSLSDTFNALWPAVAEGLVTPLNDNYKLLENPKHAGLALFKFQHDRIQQAAYALVSEAEKPSLHLNIGRLLLQHHEQADKLFELVQQLNRGIALVDDASEKTRIAQLNLQAGQRAIEEAAYNAAIEYLQIGRSLTTPVMWETDYDLILDLYVFSVKVMLLVSDYQQAEQLSKVVLQHAQTDLDKVRIYEFEVLSYAVKNQVKDAVDVGHKVLTMLGLSLKDMPPTEQNPIVYEHLPDMTNPSCLFMYRVLVSIYVPSFHVDPKLGIQTAFTMLQLQYDKGNSPLSAYIYAFYGVLRIGKDLDIDTGYQFGQMALRLMDKYQAREIKCKVLTAYHAQIKPWKEPFQNSLAPLKTAIQVGLETGDLEFTGYASMHYCSTLFLCGRPLAEISEELPVYIKMARQHQHPFPEFYIGLWGQLVHNLMGKADDIFLLKGAFIDETQHVDNPLFNMSPLKFTALLSKTILNYHFGRYQAALACAEPLEQLGKTLMGVLSPSQGYYYYALTALALYPEATPEQQQAFLTTVQRYQQRLATWARFGAVNFQHKYDLVEAELAKVLGQHWKASTLYEKAIQGAKQSGLLHDEALANELAGQFYHQQGMGKIAQVYIKDAHYQYHQWGAKPKVKQLQHDYADYFVESDFKVSETINSGKTLHRIQATQHTPSQLLDLTAILRASQVLSGEIKLDKLLVSMMNIVIKNAGADKGFLLLPKQGEWLIQAEAVVNSKQVNVLQSINIEENKILANSIVNFVIRTQKHVVWPHGEQKFDLKKDIYFQKTKPKSILCMPILNRCKMVAVLYLENKNTKYAFTEHHLETLCLLSAQISISIENAQFYAELETKVTARTAELQKQNIVLEDLNREKNAMLSIAAHDLKNPIGIVRGYAEIVEDDIDDMEIDEIITLMSKISTTSNQMLELIKKLLDVSALESGKLNFLIEPLDILLPFQELLQIYRDLGLEKNIVVHNKSTETMCVAYADSTAIWQILDNLISNAIKYSPPQRNVYLYLDNIVDKQCVRFEIKDEGPGLSQADQAKLFGKFVKLTPKPTGNEQATGLGLFSVKKLIEKIGGNVRCESVLGQGCSFIAEFPMQKPSI